MNDGFFAPHLLIICRRLIVDFTVTGIAKAPSKSDLNKKLSEAGLREVK